MISSCGTITVMIIAILIVVGLCLGSFVNALVWRLHAQMELAAKKKLTKLDKVHAAELSIVKGRSMCSNCHHPLAAKDLIPVISWLSLGGKCRYCKKPFPDTPLAELLVPLLFVGSYLAWPYAMHGAGVFRFTLWLVFLVGFVALVIYDLKWFLLPDKIVFPLIGLAVVQLVVLLAFYHGGLDLVMTTVWGVLVSSGVFYALYQISGGRWIGGGDVKLGFLLGLLLGGPGKGFLVLLLASTLGTLVSLPLLFSGKLKRDSRLPFGPLLLVAAIVAQLWGSDIISWYQQLVIIS